jgi:hypothetical protein
MSKAIGWFFLATVVGLVTINVFYMLISHEHGSGFQRGSV